MKLCVDSGLEAWFARVMHRGPMRAVMALTISLATTGLAPSASAQLLIDDFDAPTVPSTSVSTGIGPRIFSDFAPSILGGVRTTTHNPYVNPLGSVAVVAAGGGSFSSADGVGAISEALIAYGAFANPAPGTGLGGPLLGLDLSGFDALRLEFAGVSDTLNLNFTFYTAAPINPSAPTFYTTSGINVAPSVPGGPLDVLLPFAPNPDFNFGQVDGIVVIINRSLGLVPNTAYTLDTVSVVPEPSTVALCLGGLALLGWRLRRRRTAD